MLSESAGQQHKSKSWQCCCTDSEVAPSFSQRPSNFLNVGHLSAEFQKIFSASREMERVSYSTGRQRCTSAVDKTGKPKQKVIAYCDWLWCRGTGELFPSCMNRTLLCRCGIQTPVGDLSITLQLQDDSATSKHYSRSERLSSDGAPCRSLAWVPPRSRRWNLPKCRIKFERLIESMQQIAILLVFFAIRGSLPGLSKDTSICLCSR